MSDLNESLRHEAQDLLRCARAAALATLSPDGPFASLVTMATDPAGAPILLLSDLSAHTRYLGAEPRLSLMVAESGKGDPLAHPRVTIGGHARRLSRDEDAGARTRFLRRHPKAALYADFGDFAFWHVAPTFVHMNGGFARAADWPAAALATNLADADALLAGEADALDHLNADHAETLALYARVFASAEAGPWVATGLDPEGLDLMCAGRTARLRFPARITSPNELRACLVDLARAARATSAAPRT